MRKVRLIIPLFFAIVALGACVSTQRATFNTLYSLEHSVTATYDTYAYEVVRGQLPTNDVPQVSKAYDQFQIGMQAATELAQYNLGSIAPSNVVHLGTVVIKAIDQARKR